jgi:hypothetical protein
VIAVAAIFDCEFGLHCVDKLLVALLGFGILQLYSG